MRRKLDGAVESAGAPVVGPWGRALRLAPGRGEHEVEFLEERRLLSATQFPITWDQWEHLGPTFFAQLAVAEQQYPQFAAELNQDLAALQAQSDSSAGSAVAAAASAVLHATRRHPHAKPARPHHLRPPHVRPAHHPKPHASKPHVAKPHHPHSGRPVNHVSELLLPSGSGPTVTGSLELHDQHRHVRLRHDLVASRRQLRRRAARLPDP